MLSLDLNASPLHIAYAQVDKKGNLNSFGEITLSEIINKDRNQIKQILWEKAHQIIELAKEKGKAIAIEKLNRVNKGQRGDGKGKLRKRLHHWIYKGLTDKIKALARREGIEVAEVAPAYTSVIGELKYCPIYNITKDIAGAYVIGRRALGLKEKIPKNYKEILQDKEFLTYSLERLKDMYEEIKARYDKETNKYKRKAIKRELLSIRKWSILISQSLKSEPERVLEPLEGTSFGTHYHLWQVLKVALVISLLGKLFIRDFSLLRRVVISKDWKGVASQVSSLSAWAGVQSVVNQRFGIF
ncbi:MAG: IS200/IS605 family accessory protein TnpB-related protein [Hydrogenobacter thermophilus]|uniref:IS200/IS605 family accessory protein TnpB-related protein n=1 Tax=Hydrogenobacter thermophilus TaxID=940 RepID=UPI001C7769F2|nr:IS200/IS605 family accessory protein TnpB-related protein [Hydrogenobacter thermophilus]QWK20623.1 MAG: IS200/IS605 family accessory protein TnpB-related protein [Hydrogenobacter thermophilus]